MVQLCAKAAFDAGTDAKLIEKAAEAAAGVAALVPEAVIAKSLRSLPDWLPLYPRLTRDLLSSPESLWQDAKFAASI